MNENVPGNREKMGWERMQVQGPEFDLKGHMKTRGGSLFVNPALWILGAY